MRLSAQDGLRGRFRRADNKQPLRFVRWYETETGEWEAFRCDPDIAKARGIPLRSILYRGRSRLEFIQAAPLASKPSGRAASATPLDEIRAAILKGGELHVQAIVWLPGEKPPECEGAKCHRRAEWSVAVEQIVEPERGSDGRFYERAVLIDAHNFCSWCYRPPRQISQRGVETELDNIVARPQ